MSLDGSLEAPPYAEGPDKIAVQAQCSAVLDQINNEKNPFCCATKNKESKSTLVLNFK